MIFTLYMLNKISKTFFEVKYYNTLIASILFSANLQVLTNEKDYFDPDIHGNPLLHLWSLGV
jgi:peptidoglycan/LPS O-acetylase OafA/YrhL